MTKKDFIALADSLKSSKPFEDQKEELVQWQDNVNAVADACAASNPRFNRSRFLGYINGECGPSGGQVKKGRKS